MHGLNTGVSPLSLPLCSRLTPACICQGALVTSDRNTMQVDSSREKNYGRSSLKCQKSQPFSHVWHSFVSVVAPCDPQLCWPHSGAGSLFLLCLSSWLPAASGSCPTSSAEDASFIREQENIPERLLIGLVWVTCLSLSQLQR